MGQVVTLPVELSEITCGECGGVYAIAERYREQKRKQGGFWNCPYCQCGWGYGESENDKLKKQLEQERIAKERALSDANSNRLRADTAEKKVTRIQKRIKNGVCPCCNRTFTNLARHMKTKHPKV